MRRTILATFVTALLLMLAGPSTVRAAPANNPHALQFEATCEGIGTADYIEPPSNVVAFLVGGTQRTIIHHVEYQVLLVVGTEEIPIDDVSETTGADPDQQKGLQDRLIECTFDVAFPVEFLRDDEWEFIEVETGIGPDDAEEILLTGSAQVMPTPARSHAE